MIMQEMGPHLIPMLEPHPVTIAKTSNLGEAIMKIFQTPCLRSMLDSDRLQRNI